MGKWFSTGWKIFKASEHAHFGWVLLEHVLDMRGWTLTAVVFLVTFFGGALDYLRSPLDVWLAALIAAACAAILYVAGCFVRDRRASRRAARKAGQNTDVEADIDAREAFFTILERSKWRARQIESTPDTTRLVSNWLDVRLDVEIHRLLRNSKLDAWGHENLPGTATTPEKPIPPEAWDQSEIVFDRSNLPRTYAKWRVNRPSASTQMSWIGVRFSSQQVFKFFPLAEKNAAPAAPASAPYYNRDDVDELLKAMRRISVLVHQTAVEARDSVQGLMNQWAHILDKKGRAEFIAEMDRSQEKVDAVINEAWAIAQDYRHYHNEIDPILNAKNFSGQYHQSVADFRNAVSMLPGDSNYGTMLNLVMPQRDAFALAARALQEWMNVAYERLEATTKRLRSMKPGTDTPEVFAVAIDTNARRIGDFPVVCALKLTNVSRQRQDVLVKMEQFTGGMPDNMPSPFVLRTENQTLEPRSGSFRLRPNEPKTIPILYRDPIRATDWSFLDEHGRRHATPAGPFKMVIGVYSDTASQKYEIVCDTDAGWKPHSPTIVPVSNDHIVTNDWGFLR